MCFFIIYLQNLKTNNKNMSKLFYRIAHKDTQQGVWYDSEGNFTNNPQRKPTYFSRWMNLVNNFV